MNHAKQLLARFRQDESGQNLVEYALVVGLVALAALTAMTNLGGAVCNMFGKIVYQLGGVQ